MAVVSIVGIACDRPESTRLEDMPLPHVRVSPVQLVMPRPRSRHLVPLVPSKEARLAPRSGGEVVSVRIDEEQRVEPGTLLIQLAADDPKGGLISARASIRRIEENLRDNERELKRVQKLTGQGVESARSLEQLETERAVLQAQLAQSRGSLVQARDRVGATSLVAPFAGVVVTLETEVGEYLAPGATALTLAQLDPIAVEVPLTQAEAQQYDEHGLRFQVIARGQPVLPELEWLSSMADPTTSTFTARLIMANPDQRLRAGELVSVAVLSSSSAKVKAVPALAIRWAASTSYVLRVKNDVVERVDVSVFDDSDELVVIEGDIDPGDLIVSAGPTALLTGDKVHVVTRSEALVAREGLN